MSVAIVNVRTYRSNKEARESGITGLAIVGDTLYFVTRNGKLILLVGEWLESCTGVFEDFTDEIMENVEEVVGG